MFESLMEGSTYFVRNEQHNKHNGSVKLFDLLLIPQNLWQ